MNVLVKINNFMRHEEWEDSYENSESIVFAVCTPNLKEIPVIKNITLNEYNLISNVLMEIANEKTLKSVSSVMKEIRNELLYLILDVGASEAVSIMLSDEYERYAWNKTLQDEIDEISELVLNAFETESDEVLCNNLNEIIVNFIGNYDKPMNIHQMMEFSYNRDSENYRREFICSCISTAQGRQGRFMKNLSTYSEFVLDENHFNDPQDCTKDGVSWGFKDADDSCWYRYSINISPLEIPEFGSVVLFHE